MLFKNVVGQNNAKAGIVGMWHNDTFPHALMIAGGEGTGGLPMALATAQYVLCENKTENDACGTCANCSKCERMEHADLHYTFPCFPPKANTPGKSVHYMKEFREFAKKTPYGTTYEWLQFINAENKQGKITADEAEEILATLYLKSYEGGRKIQIIWRPEYLFKEGNKLLKLIEEPPSDTILILVAENMEDVLGTIRSRTQTVKLSPIGAADIAESLVRNAIADPVRAAQVAAIAMGSYTEALKLMQHTDNDMLPDVKMLFSAIIANKGNGDGVAITKFVTEWSQKGREQQKNFLYYAIALVEHAIKFRYVPHLQLAQPEADFIRNLVGKNIPHENLYKMAAVMTETASNIERNAHSKSQLMAMAIRMRYVLNGRAEAVFG